MSLESPQGLIDRLPAGAQAAIRLLLYEIAELKAEVASLRNELACQGKTPRNFSLPPSMQHPYANPERPLTQTEKCDRVIVQRPTQCRRCGTKLAGDDREQFRHRLYGFPEIKLIVIDYQRH